MSRISTVHFKSNLGRDQVGVLRLFEIALDTNETNVNSLNYLHFKTLSKMYLHTYLSFSQVEFKSRF